MNFHRQREKVSHYAIGVPIISKIAHTTSASRIVRKIALQSIEDQCGAGFIFAMRRGASLGSAKP